MKSQNISNVLQVIARPEVNLKSGDFVYINVVKKLFKNKWAVSVKGRVFSAYSDIDLIPGQKIKVLVNNSGNKLLLHVKETKTELLNNIMKQMGTTDNLSRLILTSLIRSKIPISSEIISKIKHHLLKSKKNHKRAARNLAVILKKNIDISGEGIDSILNIFESDPNPNKDNNKQKEELKHQNDIKKALKKQIEKTTETGDHPLQLFNHLNGKEENWIVLPYNFNIDGLEYNGKIKMLYDFYNKKIIKFVFSVKSMYNTEWDIYCRENNNYTNVSIFCNNSVYKKIFDKKCSRLELSLKHMDIQIDADLHTDSEFDGFSPDWDDISLKKIDTFT